nr:hypothetical protein BaRGS_030776 [Batillaria attramentaria]
MMLTLSMVEVTQSQRNGRWRDRWNQFLQQLRNRFGDREGFGFFGRHQPWWEGANVCRSVVNSAPSGTTQHRPEREQCRDSGAAYTCVSTITNGAGTVVRTDVRQCCHGYARQRNDFGCPIVLQLSNLPQTAQSLGLNDLLGAVTTAGLGDALTNSNFTVFAPKDGSFAGVSLPVNELQAVLLSHVIAGPRRSSSFSDEEVLQTASPLGSTIRINVYTRPQTLTTANCVPVTSADNIATNGVIHVVDKILPTVTSSIMDLIAQDPQFSLLRTALEKANLVTTFQGTGQFTLFAPTNAAFQSLDQTLLNRLINGDVTCLQKVLKQHVLPNVICSAIIQPGNARALNLLDNYVNLTHTGDGSVLVNDAQVIRADVMATNGVIHAINGVLIPNEALDIVNVAQRSGLTELTQLVQTAGLTSTLQNAQNVTVFAPTNEAFQILPAATVQQLTSNPALLQQVLTYHVVPQQLSVRQLTASNSQQLNTLNTPAKLRVNQYFGYRQRVVTVQCAPVITTDVPACNGVAHVISQLLIPPTGTVVDVLVADPNYSTLVELVQAAGLVGALQTEGPFTVFAPNNQAFAQLGQQTLQELRSDVQQLAYILRLHVIQDNLCCAGIFRNPWWRQQRSTALSGDPLFLSRDRTDTPIVNDVSISNCDNIATNGIVHGVDSVLLPRFN